jgi:hypothetical protein
MKRLLCLCVVIVLGMDAPARADLFACLNHGIHCIVPPPPDCPDCGCPCEHGIHHCSPRKCEHAHELIEQLSSGCCCDRIKAAEKLGCRLHADYCCTPEILPALSHAIVCDSCWEVRKAAAWAIAYQKARVEQGVLALYLASKLDPHYLVRDAATDALSVLLVCRRECFKDLFTQADALVKQLRGKYEPGKEGCELVLNLCFGGPAVSTSAPAPSLVPTPGTTPDLSPAPGLERGGLTPPRETPTPPGKS